jgi:pterin-4a-carbinolamine dehydratase
MRNSQLDLPGVHRLPVQPKEPSVPLIPQSRWELIRDSNCAYLTKTYQFMKMIERNNFIKDMLVYEEEFEHSSNMIIQDLSVKLSITTKNIGVTEIDKDYTRYADEIFKDVTFNV